MWARAETGIIVAVDGKTVQARVRLPAWQDIVSPWFPVVSARAGDDAALWMPDLGEQVLCLVDGEIESGFILGSLFNAKAPPPTDDLEVREVRFKDGTLVRYNRGSKELFIDSRGSIKLHALGNIELVAQGNVTVKGAQIRMNDP